MFSVKSLLYRFEQVGKLPSFALKSNYIAIIRVTISCLFLRFMLIFKGNVLENVNVLIFKKRAYF